jgi:succinyl-diaminopimelate desuccinylase
MPTVSKEQVFDVVERKRKHITTLLQDLIRIPTVVPPGNNYTELVDYAEPLFRKMGFQTERVVVPEKFIKTIPYPLEGPRVNLVATRDHGCEEYVTIYAHMDVVPVEEPWTKDPFAGVVEDGKIYGRGVLDMKCGIAGMLVAIEVIDELGLIPHFNLVCTLCTDEEIGVYPGIYHLAKEGYVKGHFLNTELGAQLPLMIVGTAGDVDVSIKTKGRSCHSGMNFLGVNAVEAMVPILNELLILKAEVEQRESSVPTIPLLKSMGAPSDKMTPMFNLDIIRGGTKSNIVPSECEVIINRRYIPEEQYEDVVGEIKEAVDRGRAKSKALDVEVVFTHCYPALKLDLQSPYLKRMREALQAVKGYKDDEILYAGISGSTDMGHVAEVLKGIHFVMVGPAAFDNFSAAHAADEWIRIDDLINMTKQLVHYLAL